MRIRQSLLAAGALLAAAGVSRAGSVSYTYAGDGNKIVQYTAPTTGTYDITAIGAGGGSNTYASDVGGGGASVEGNFSLTSGETLDILVGQLGFNSSQALSGGGGGGGTFVVIDDTTTPLLIAGGGGGAGRFMGNNGQAAGSLSLQDGSGGYGGMSGGNSGAGGGGFSGNGSDGPGTEGGESFKDGGAGGAASYMGGGNGGFGGGGAGGNGGGGGGGYNGGGPGIGIGGDAGASYYNQTYLVGPIENYSSAGTLADGSVTITLVPVPAAAEAGGLLLAALGLMKYRRRLVKPVRG